MVSISLSFHRSLRTQLIYLHVLFIFLLFQKTFSKTWPVSGVSRIRHTGDAYPKVGSQPNILDNLPWKLHENEENWTPGSAPWLSHWQCKELRGCPGTFPSGRIFYLEFFGSEMWVKHGIGTTPGTSALWTFLNSLLQINIKMLLIFSICSPFAPNYFYHPHPKDGEGNVFSLSTPGGGVRSSQRGGGSGPARGVGQVQPGGGQVQPGGGQVQLGGGQVQPGGVSILRPLVGGMPLAFTQEDFLVWGVLSIFWHHFELMTSLSKLKLARDPQRPFRFAQRRDERGSNLPSLFFVNTKDN